MVLILKWELLKEEPNLLEVSLVVTMVVVHNIETKRKFCS